jgi:hypothetical protein
MTQEQASSPTNEPDSAAGNFDGACDRSMATQKTYIKDHDIDSGDCAQKIPTYDNVKGLDHNTNMKSNTEVTEQDETNNFELVPVPIDDGKSASDVVNSATDKEIQKYNSDDKVDSDSDRYTGNANNSFEVKPQEVVSLAEKSQEVVSLAEKPQDVVSLEVKPLEVVSLAEQFIQLNLDSGKLIEVKKINTIRFIRYIDLFFIAFKLLLLTIPSLMLFHRS